MQIITFTDSDIGRLEDTVEGFIIGRVILNVSYDRTSSGAWRADIYYLDI